MEIEDQLASALLRFKVDYDTAKTLPIGTAIKSKAFSAGGHRWRVHFYPRGKNELSNGDYTALHFELLGNSVTKRVKAVFEVFLTNKGGSTFCITPRSDALLFGELSTWFWDPLFPVASLEQEHVVEGKFHLICAVTVISDNSIPVPPQDIGKDLSALLETADGSDVAFTVAGEVFPAHRSVLAARSPVFRAELFGSMSEFTMSNITLEGIAAPIFKPMLQYMYSDVLPNDEEFWNGNLATRIKTLLQLLELADRYAIDRLKYLCARRVWDIVPLDLVPVTLGCAEKFNCPELKIRCLDFMASPKNHSVLATADYVEFAGMFPHVRDELWKKLVLLADSSLEDEK